MTALEEMETAVAGIRDRVGGSVVGIGARVRGSGFVFEPGRVATNAHNLRGERVTVHVGGEARLGDVLGVDPDGDLAVVGIDTGTIVPLSPAGAPVAVGRAVLGVAALPTGGARVTVGFVSAVERTFRGPRGRLVRGSIEHTAPLAQGSSGGPLVDLGGRLVGINTNRIGDGFYLALPADEALAGRLAALARGEVVRRPILGVAVVPAHVARRLRRSVGLPDREGVLVRGVEEGSAAQRGGIREGDLVVAVGGAPVADPDDLHDALATAEFPLRVTVVRGVEEVLLSVDEPDRADRGSRPGEAGR